MLVALVLCGSSAAMAGAQTATPADSPPPAHGAGYLPYSEPHPLAEVNVWGALGRSVVALGVVLGLMGGAVVLARRVLPGIGGGSGQALVRVVGRVGLAPKQTVFFLQLPGRILVVGSAAGQMTTLAEITDPHEMAELVQAGTGLPVVGGAAFGGVFKRYLTEVEGAAPPVGPRKPDGASDAIRRQIANLRALAKRDAS